MNYREVAEQAIARFRANTEATKKRINVETPFPASAGGQSRDFPGEYRRVLWRLWQLAAAGPNVDATEARGLLREVSRLESELGPAMAETIRLEWRTVYEGETGRGAWSGEQL